MGIACRFNMQYTWTIPPRFLDSVKKAVCRSSSLVRRLRHLRKCSTIDDRSLRRLICKGEKNLTMRTVLCELLKTPPIDITLCNGSWSQQISCDCGDDGDENEKDGDVDGDEVSKVLQLVTQEEEPQELSQEPEELPQEPGKKGEEEEKEEGWKIEFVDTYYFPKGYGSYMTHSQQLVRPGIASNLQAFVERTCRKEDCPSKEPPELSPLVIITCVLC